MLNLPRLHNHRSLAHISTFHYLIPRTITPVQTRTLYHMSGSQCMVLICFLTPIHYTKANALAKKCHRHSISPIYTLPISKLGLLLDLFPSSGFVSKLDRSGLTQESLELDVLASPPTGPPTIIGANSWLLSCDGKTYEFIQ